MRSSNHHRASVPVILAAACVWLLPAAAGAWTEQDDQVDADIPEMVVEAENQVRQDIQKSTFTLELGAAVIDTFFSREDEEVMAISPVGGLQSLVNNPGSLSTDQVPHCWAPEMAGSPVATFFPEDPEGHDAENWRLTVTDFRGSPFREYRGDGKPPRTVSWDGRDDQKKMLEVGYPYSYLYSVTDKGTNTYNYAGVSFRIPAVDYREDNDRRLDYAGDRMFEKRSGDLVEEGRAWLTGALDIIRRDHPYSPLKVLVVAEEERLAARRADTVKEFVTAGMIITPDKVEIETLVKPNLRAELDGSVSILIEHTD